MTETPEETRPAAASESDEGEAGAGEPKPGEGAEPAQEPAAAEKPAKAEPDDAEGAAAKKEPAAKEPAGEREPAAAEKKPAAGKPAPKKPVPRKPAAEKPADSGMSRRGFFSWAAVAWVGFTAAIGGCLTAWGRFMFPNVLYEPPTSFKVGPPSEFPPGTVDERFKESNGVWIVNLEGRIVALIAICTHLGCPPNWLEAQNKFKCPCHGSGYYRNGVNFEGPTPRPLERAKIGVDSDDGQILVDKSQKYLWERGQWDDPDSFIEMA